MSGRWIEDLRQSANTRFRASGMPRLDTEEWRWTQLQPVLETTFGPASGQVTPAAGAAARDAGFRDQAQVELVFVNGSFAPELSQLGELPRGVTVGPLAAALRGPAGPVRQLGQHARIDGTNPFVAWNTGQFTDGALVHLERGVALERPIHLVFVAVPGAEPAVAHPRTLVVAEAGACAAVVESYVGAGSGRGLTNAVTEIVLGDDAVLDHCKLQRESVEAYHLAAMMVTMGRGAQFVSHAVTIGGAVTRNDLACILAGEGGYATLNGLVLIGGRQHCDTHTLLRHEAAHCPSHELYKHVLADQASGVFKGKILVQQGAQKTDSKQTSKSLLLSDEATMNSQPALEIYADDVKCTHGSTTGPVDEEMVFYLRSRGVGREAARHLLTYAFAADITRRIKVEPVRRRVEDYMAAQHDLPQDLRISDLGAFDDAAL
jgi:Fe-S cluster assembly protein SufD